jgi:hypothetical protein
VGTTGVQDIIESRLPGWPFAALLMVGAEFPRKILRPLFPALFQLPLSM